VKTNPANVPGCRKIGEFATRKETCATKTLTVLELASVASMAAKETVVYRKSHKE